MKSILQEIYEDGLLPSENPIRILSEHNKLRQEHLALYDALSETLNEKQRQQLLTLWNQVFDGFQYSDCESFIYGFQLGARIMLEVTGHFPAS